MKSAIEKENRKKRGEVFTPPLLAEEMIYKIPEIKIDNKILDACSGATCVFPIMLMFRYVKQFGKEHIPTYINKCIHMAEINELAVEYSQVILMKYVKMLEIDEVEVVRLHYIENYKRIISDYYDFCELSEGGV